MRRRTGVWAVGGRDKFLVDDILGIRPLGGSYISVNDNRVAAFGRGSHGLLEPLAYQLLDERTRAQMRSDTSTKFHILNQFIKFTKKKNTSILSDQASIFKRCK